MLMIIEVHGYGCDIEYVKIDAVAAAAMLSDGVDEDDLSDLWDDSDTESGLSSELMLFVDGSEMVLALDNAEEDASHSIADGSDGSWLLVKIQEERGVFRRFQVSGEFDAGLISLSVNRVDVRGVKRAFYEVLYDGDSGEFGDTDVKHQEIFLLDPSGQRHDFDVL